MSFLLWVPVRLSLFVILIAPSWGQAPPAPSSQAERGIDLATKGRCGEAVPILTESVASITDKELKYRALLATARCGIRQKDGRATVNAIMALKHDFPHDPEVLYLTTHVFLQIAVDASQELSVVAPKSYQLLELEAETFESQSKWEEAAAVYRQILEQNPKVPNIHSRLGRMILSQPESPSTNEAARKEFEQELAIDPTNASAEFWLGEIARREGKSAEAIPHFRAALKLDPALVEAMLALGMTHNSDSQFADAIDPLEQYVKMVPGDPAGHYQLALAYARTGRKEDSRREMELQQQFSEKKQAPPAAPGGAVPQ